MANIKSIAEYTILRLNLNGQTICPLKLQKILYYIQAWHLVYFDDDIYDGLEPEAWVNGPVYRDVYNVYRDTGIYDMLGLSVLNIDVNNLENEVRSKKDQLGLNDNQNDYLDSIYSHYGSMSHDRLVYLTHSEKPWNTARVGVSPIEYSKEKISIEVMKEYYKSLSDK